MIFFGIVFLVTSLLIAILKREINVHHVNKNERELSLSVMAAYRIIWKMFKIKYMRRLAVIWLTTKIGFACEHIGWLKLIEAGVPRENLTLLVLPMMPFNIAWPLIISKYTNGKRPLDS
jgi:MFS transporter, PAT family, solute carrier family 33 (acetyl-CoA transportor), member 1